MITPWRAAGAALASVVTAGTVAVAGAVPAATAAPAVVRPAAAGGPACAGTAPTDRQAAAMARRCHTQVEVAAERTDRTRVFANPDGTATLRAAAVAAGAQPNSQIAGRNRWAYANSSNSNNNDGVARVGADPGGGGTYRSYFEFPIGAAAGSHVIAAAVNTTMIHSWSCDSTPVTLWWSGPIPAGVNGTRLGWSGPALPGALDQRSGHAHKPSGGAGCGNDPQPDMPIQFAGANLTAHEQTWANQRVGAVTMALTAADPSGANEGTGNRWKKFSVASTVLVVQFNFPPAAPAPAALSAVGTSQTVACWTGDVPGQPGVNATGGLHLRATLTDQDAGDNVLARFEWQDVTAGTPVTAVPDTAAFPSGHTYDVGLAAAGLPDGHTIQWRVHGWDGRDNGAVSAWCTLLVDDSTPGQPTLSSSDLPAYPGAPAAAATVGAPVVVTATPAAGDADIRGYYVGVGAVETVPTTWVPAGAGGVAAIPVVPVVSGIAKNFLTVLAVDAAGNRAPVPLSAADAPGTRQFRANPATGARGRGDTTGDGLGDLAGLLDAGGGRTALVNLDTAAGGGAVLTPALPLTTDPNVFPVARLVPVRGDFNGDGRADIAAFRDDGGCRTTLWWWLSDGNGYRPSTGPLWDGGPSNWCLANAPKVVAGDLTGDGRADIGAFYSYLNNRVKLWVWPGSATGTGFDPPALWWDSGIGNWEYSHFQAAAGDVDGDGDDDIVQLYDYNNCSSATILFTSGRTTITAAFRTWRSADNEFCWARLSKPLVGDLDGDGRADVSALYDLGNGTWEPITVFAAAPAAVQVTAAHTLTVPGRIRPAMADYTGDGRPDIGLLSNDGASATSIWVAPQSGAADHSFDTETKVWDSTTTIGGFTASAFTLL
jgi:FG-GAP-like repeat